MIGILSSRLVLLFLIFNRSKDLNVATFQESIAIISDGSECDFNYRRISIMEKPAIVYIFIPHFW